MIPKIASMKQTNSHIALEALYDKRLDTSRPVSTFDTLGWIDENFMNALTHQDTYIVLPETYSEFKSTVNNDFPFFNDVASCARRLLPPGYDTDNEDLSACIHNIPGDTIMSFLQSISNEIKGLPNYQKIMLQDYNPGVSHNKVEKNYVSTKAAIPLVLSSMLGAIMSCVKVDEPLLAKMQDELCTSLNDFCTASCKKAVERGHFESIQMSQPFSLFFIYENTGLSAQSLFNVKNTAGRLHKNSSYAIQRFENVYLPLLVKIGHDDSERAHKTISAFKNQVTEKMPDRLVSVTDYLTAFRKYY